MPHRYFNGGLSVNSKSSSTDTKPAARDTLFLLLSYFRPGVRVWVMGWTFVRFSKYDIPAKGRASEILRPTKHIPIIIFLFSSTFLYRAITSSMSGETAAPKYPRSTKQLLKKTKISSNTLAVSSARYCC